MDTHRPVTLFPTIVADGPTQMGTDEWMLERAIAGRTGFRVYAWSEPTVSLGYFQRFDGRPERWRTLPTVRRATGGGAIIHHVELTYCFALPPGREWQSAESWVCRMHHAIGRALGLLGVSIDSGGCGVEVGRGDFVCFSHQMPGDVLLSGHKVVGSAQRKRQGALLQHGSVLLSTSEHAPHLRGICELSNKLINPLELITHLTGTMTRDFGWQFDVQPWPVGDDQLTAFISRYRSDEWNRKR